MYEIIEPIRHKKDRLKFKKYWYKYSLMGPRNWMMFQLGIVTALRASDICKIKLTDVFNKYGRPRKHLVGHDIKTRKANSLLIKPLASQLKNYRKWLIKNHIYKEWLFPAFGKINHRVRPNYLYKSMHNAAIKLHIPNIGSHSLRKTFGYLAYQKTHNIVYVMHMLNHSNPMVTLRYIGVEQERMDKITNSIFK